MLLSRPWSLLGINDVEAYCARIVHKLDLGDLPSYVAVDLHAFLISRTWELSLLFQPGGISFSTYAGHKLRQSAIDWLRNANNGGHGRTVWKSKDRIYKRARTQLVALDDLSLADYRTLGFVVGPGEGDPSDDCCADLERILATRDRDRTRDIETLGLRPPRRAA